MEGFVMGENGSAAVAVVTGLAGAARRVWPYRRELTPVAAGAVAVVAAAQLIPMAAAAAVVAAPAALVLAVGPTRRRLWGWVRCGRTRRQLDAALRALKVLDVHGRTPRVVRIRRTPVGEEVRLAARGAGHFSELVEFRTPELRAALRARTVLVDRDPARADRFTVDVVRIDPFAKGTDVAWRDLSAERCDLWRPVHLGLSDRGQPVDLSLIERHVLFGGLPGSGKSSGVQVLVASAAKDPTVQLLLLDPNRVQLGPWKHRSMVFVDDSVTESVELLRLVQAEISRRTRALEALPGVVRKVSAQVLVDAGMHLWLVVIDELAYYTSVAGNQKTQADFSGLLRDIVARARAVGIIVIVATQRPTQDVVPRAVADLFPVRIAYRVNNAANSDVILGEGMAKRGFNAAEIPSETPGVGWLLGEGLKPRRFRGCWLPDDVISDLAFRTIEYRSPAPRHVILAPATSAEANATAGGAA
jgi:S-DNA-T family DNA segregation ATPase FtsK/SpoIIIE